jgi:hypothetical protein
MHFQQVLFGTEVVDFYKALRNSLT